MANLEFIMKHCHVGQMLLERIINETYSLLERRKLFEETGSYGTSDEAAYKRHVEKCPVYRDANRKA